MRCLTNVLVGLGRGSLASSREFRATLAHCIALKLTGESVKTASLNGVNDSCGVDGRVGDGEGDGDDVTRRRTFVGKNG